MAIGGAATRAAALPHAVLGSLAQGTNRVRALNYFAGFMAMWDRAAFVLQLLEHLCPTEAAAARDGQLARPRRRLRSSAAR